MPLGVVNEAYTQKHPRVACTIPVHSTTMTVRPKSVKHGFEFIASASVSSFLRGLTDMLITVCTLSKLCVGRGVSVKDHLLNAVFVVLPGAATLGLPPIRSTPDRVENGRCHLPYLHAGKKMVLMSCSNSFHTSGEVSCHLHSLTPLQKMNCFPGPSQVHTWYSTLLIHIAHLTK